MKWHCVTITSVFTVLALSYGRPSPAQPKFVEINGKRQWTFKKGEGTPTVLFVTGLGTDLKDFYKIQLEIAKTTGTLSYDRAGLGKSEALESARSIDNMAKELHEILLKEHIQPPYLLVGHSFGGYILRLFAEYYPQKVAGLIFIDPSSEGFREARRSNRNPHERARLDSLMGVDNPRLPEGIRREQQHMYTTDVQLLKGIELPDNIPITLITSSRFSQKEQNGGLTEKDMQAWVALHKKMLRSAPQARHLITENSGHAIHAEEPQLVIAEIMKMIRTIRKNHPKVR